MANGGSLSIDWYKVGFDEGCEAGQAEIIPRDAPFEPIEEALALGHLALDGNYTIIRRRQLDFHSFDDIHAWMSGVFAGIEAVGARFGFQTTIEYPYSRADGGAVTYIFVTRDLVR